MKKLKVKFPNGDTFEIPAEFIAKARTAYYAHADGFQEDSKEWKEEFKQSMYPDEIVDWAANNMDWEDLKYYAVKVVDEEKPNYDELWSDADLEVTKG